MHRHRNDIWEYKTADYKKRVGGGDCGLAVTGDALADDGWKEAWLNPSRCHCAEGAGTANDNVGTNTAFKTASYWLSIE